MGAKRKLRLIQCGAPWLLACLLLAPLAAGPAAAGLISVSSTADVGPGTLRSAINLANLSPEPDVIVFTTGAATITVGNTLPVLMDNDIEIRGDTGPITLSNGGGVATGIHVNADSCVVRGMTITGFGTGIKLTSVSGSCRFNVIGGLAPGHGNTLTGNGLGIVLDGGSVRRNIVLGNTVDQSTVVGIQLQDASDNVIGPSNAVMRSGTHGIYLAGNSATAERDTIAGNTVGTDAALTTLRGNSGDGIRIEGSGCQYNRIVNNVCVDNGERGIHFKDLAQFNTAERNSVGFVPGASRPNQYGISATVGADNNEIGPENVVTGNTSIGIELNSVQYCTVNENIVGLDGGGAALGNGGAGIYVTEVPNTIDLNVICANGTHGIHADGPRLALGALAISRNYIGTDASGASGFGNTQHGIFITDDFPGNFITDNVVSDNGQAGIYLDNLCGEQTITRNLIGVDPLGVLALPNDIGMVIRSNSNTIGGSYPGGEGNLIARNIQDGIRVVDATTAEADTNFIWGNTIEDNGGNGIWFMIGASENLVGDFSSVAPDRGNVIKNNGGHGVRVGENSCPGDCPVGNRIVNNSITGNTGDAIDLFSSAPPGNNGIVSPTILGATTTQVWGVTNLSTTLPTLVQVFKDAVDEKEIFLGEVSVPTGTSVWSVTVVLSPGDIVTATNTANYPTLADPIHTSEPADTFQVATGAPTIAFSGLINSALGSAAFMLTAPPATAGPAVESNDTPNLPLFAPTQNLRVTNIGSSGDDGVSIDFGGTDGGTVSWVAVSWEFAPGNDFSGGSTAAPEAVPAGTQYSYDAYGRVNGQDDQPVGSVNFFVDSFFDVEVQPDFTPLGLTSSRLVALSNSTVLGVVPAATTPTMADALPTSCTVQSDYTPGPPLAGWPLQGPTLPLPALIYRWDPPATLDLPGLGGPIVADELRIIADLGSNGFVTTVEEISRLEFRVLAAPGPGAITDLIVSDESARRHRRPHRGLGQALLNYGAPLGPATAGLRISNIGSSGEDGVQIPERPFDLERRVRWARLDRLDPVPTGARVSFETRGTMSGMPEQRVGRAELVRRPTDYQASADFATMSPTAVRIEIWDDTDIVHMSSVAGATAMVYADDEPSGVGRGLDQSIEYTFPVHIPLTVAGGPTVMGDLIRFVPEGPAVEPTDWDDHLLTAKEIPGGELILIGEPNTVDLGSGWTAQAAGIADLERSGAMNEALRISNLNPDPADDGMWLIPDTPTNVLSLSWAPLGPPPAPVPNSARADRGASELGVQGTVETEILAMDFTMPVGEPWPLNVGRFILDLGFQLHGDLVGLGATMMTLRAYDGGTLVDQMTGVPNGMIGAVDRSIIGCGAVIDGGVPHYWVDLLPGTNLTLGPLAPPARDGGAAVSAVTADRLIIVPEDPQVVPTAVAEVGLFSSTLAQLLVTEVGTSPPLDAPAEELPMRTMLRAAAPNPFGTHTRIHFDLARTGDVSLRVFDLGGRRVQTLAEGRFEPGQHTAIWDGADATGRRAAPGVYFIRLEAPGYSASRKVVRLK